MGLHMITGAVVAAIVGSFFTGLALALGWLHMPWSRAFALGVYGGAALGFVLGALVAAMRPRERELEIEIKKRGTSRRRAPAVRYRSA